MKKCVALLFAVAGIVGNAATQGTNWVDVLPRPFVLACQPGNDLFMTMRRCGLKPNRFDSPALAIDAAPVGSMALLLADDYPQTRVDVSDALYQKAAAKNIILYVEFPSSVPGIKFGPAQKTTWERFVVSEKNPRNLSHGQILMAQEYEFLPCNAPDPIVVVARVAGYNNATYGIPASAHPILFGTADNKILVATTQLSRFISGRFAPTQEWEALWKNILGVEKLSWTPRVQAAYGPRDSLPKNYERNALQNAVGWTRTSGLLVAPQRRMELEPLWKQGIELTPASTNQGPPGDGQSGILEGFNSSIHQDGSQWMRTPIRADCQAESAMLFAMDWSLEKKRDSWDVGSNLLDFLYFNSDMCGGARGNPRDPAFGLISWGAVTPAWTVANYGDDNARTMLATMLVEACFHSDRWNERLLRALYANLRTTGRLGFRGDRIDMPDLERNGWRPYADGSPVNYSPHFESYLWACYLWAYAHTWEQEFLDKAKSGIRMTVKAFPEKWRWNDNNERARMLLCLSWLVRVEDTEEHRRWLRLIANDLIGIQNEYGAFPEHFRGNRGSYYQIPPSNEAYGTGETPLMQEEGDPVTDQLYVTGFALLGLHEAAATLHDPAIKAAERRAAQYACRIQTKSKSLPQLAGTWFRAFDFERWEPWASSGDAGWGAWSEETGWAQAWTAATLGLRQMHSSFWDVTAPVNLVPVLPQVRAEMAENDGEPLLKR